MGIGPVHLMVLAAIALLIFGPAKLPALGKSLGDAIRGFKDAMDDATKEVDQVAQSAQLKASESTEAESEAEIVEPAAAEKPKKPVS